MCILVIVKIKWERIILFERPLFWKSSPLGSNLLHTYQIGGQYLPPSPATPSGRPH